MRLSTFIPVASIGLLVSVSTVVHAAPPAGYYSSASGLSGSALRTALHNIIDDHKVIPYSSSALDVYDACEDLDESPSSTSRVRLMYSSATELKSNRSAWNREHSWPQSYGVSSGPANSDLHHIFACDMNVNSSRGNKYYDNGGTSFHPEAPDCRYDSDSWQVRVQDRGDIARAILYMDVRYSGDKSGELDLFCGEATGSVTPTAGGRFMGKLATLIAWHNQDPPDALEIARNDKIYFDYQGNRNPFIDNPSYVGLIWGGSTTPTPTPTPVGPTPTPTRTPAVPTATPTRTPTPPATSTTVVFYSNSAYDGNVQESGFNTNVGSSVFSSSTTIRVGDLNSGAQYRGVVHFDTASIPDGAVIQSAVLRIRQSSFSGSPSSLGTITVDVSSAFGGSVSLSSADFAAAASASSVATLSYPTSGGWSTGAINSSGLSFINKFGSTQFRIRFTSKTDGDSVYDYINYLSGENSTSSRPVLEVTYR